MASAWQIRAIKVLTKKAGLEDADYRDLLIGHTGKRSSTELSHPAAGRFIELLKGRSTAPSVPAEAVRADRATGPFAKVLQALWLSAWNLGIVQSKDDRALIAFAERQTGLSHTRFLVDHRSANRVIEALKAWIAREAPLTWPPDRDDKVARKIVVAEAIARRLIAAGGFTPFLAAEQPWPADFEGYGAARGLPASFAAYASEDWDGLIGVLGARLRTDLAKGKPKGGAHG